MLTQAESNRLTHVVGDAPMARLMREHCWVPFAREASLSVGQAPQRVRLFGDDFVAFRGEDGRVGLVDERCPHRGVSLALANVEGCSLRCIYHGWRIDLSGSVVEVPSEGPRSTEVAAKMQVNHYAVREAGGLVWAYLGREAQPEFPKLPFMDAPPENRFIARTLVPCNWLQSLEGGLDSSHVGWLHQSWFPSDGEIDPVKVRVPPVFKTKDTSYGMRAAAIRALPDGSSYLRIAEYLMPFTILLATDRPAAVGREFSSFMMVPIDDRNHLLFWYIWNDAGPLADVGFSSGKHDLDNYARLRGGREDNWGQDRDARSAGHFSGFTDMLLQEDVAAQVSMGPVADRTREHLCATDVAVAHCRRTLLRLLKRFEEGEEVGHLLTCYEDEGTLPFAGAVPGDFDWANEEMGVAA
jgi:phthalate 4,5-dioxygenase oxygenase subunit